jgi:hypothetical protein
MALYLLPVYRVSVGSRLSSPVREQAYFVPKQIVKAPEPTFV